MSKIPKIIHYCWFGRNEKSEVIKKCIASWKKHLPDYELIEWSEDNFDIESNRYVKEAYEQKKWAFVSDYVRLWAVNHFGGVYLDTDVMIYQNLDCFLEQRAICGFQDPFSPFTALFAAEKSHPWIQRLFAYYSDAQFLTNEGNADFTTNTEIVKNIMVNECGVKLNNKRQELPDGLVVYPSYYFCTPKVSMNDAYAEHLFDGSWLKIPLWKRALIRVFGSKGRYYYYASYYIHFTQRLKRFFR